MKEINTDIWQIWNDTPNAALCVTTNGIVKRNGEAVMGRGMALQAKQHLGNYIATVLGSQMQKHGNHVHELINDNNTPLTAVLSFPTKNDWKDRSSISLIAQSAMELMNWLNNHQGTTAMVTRPGCENGNLKWENVKETLSAILDDRVTVVECK
jgi:hypothetical protein